MLNKKLFLLFFTPPPPQFLLWECKEPEPVMQKDSDSVLTTATNVLQGILDKIDDQHSTTAPKVPPSRTNVTTQPEPDPCESTEGIPEETPEGTPQELITEADLNFDEDQKPSNKSGGTDMCPSASEGEVMSSVSLPHEGERWARLRNQVIGLPYFKGYLSRTDENLSWSVDEAFASFCLDRWVLKKNLTFYGCTIALSCKLYIGQHFSGLLQKIEAFLFTRIPISDQVFVHGRSR